MIIVRTLLLLIVASFSVFADANSDREKIAHVMADFQQWDHLGGVELAKKSLAQTVRYNYVDKEGKHVSYTVDFAYQGKAAYKPYIVALDIYGNMAVVKAIHHYNNEQAYLKAFVLHKLSIGWRITNVSWGQITPDK